MSAVRKLDDRQVENMPEAIYLREAGVLGLTAGEKARLRHAMRLRIEGMTLIAERSKTRGRKMVNDADAIVAEVRREVNGSRDGAIDHERAKLKAAALAEIEAWEAENGAMKPKAKAKRVRDADTGVVIEAAGRIRIKNRDGLQSLHDLGHIDRRQLVLGMNYRVLHEAVAHGLRSQLGDGGPADPEHDAFTRGMLRAKRGQLRSMIDRMVAIDCRHEPVALSALRLVAGEGQTVDSLTSGGRAFSRYVEALKLALDVVGKVL